MEEMTSLFKMRLDAGLFSGKKRERKRSKEK